MKTSAKIYAIAVSIIGCLVGAFCVYRYYMQIVVMPNPWHELGQFAILFLLALLCRCLPIYIRPDYAIDMAFISNFAILLCKGPIVAASITLLCSPFVIMPAPDREKRLSHIFNTDPLKTAFNTANFTLSVFAGGTIFIKAGGVVGNLDFPGVLMPSVAMIFTIIIVNSIILIMLFRLNSNIPFFPSLLKNLADFLPSVIAAAPIGYFIATFMLMDDGEYLVILFVLPLLLARFAFSMYIDVKQNYYVMLKTLTNTIEAKDEYTRGHSERVEVYAKIVAQEMRFSAARVDELCVAALLHDVGKIGIDENILKKPDRLDPEERIIIQTHPEISVNILKEVKLSPMVFNIILHHHERYDGGGYPSGMGGDELPLDVYVLGVADTYDAITSDRPYSRGRSAEVAKRIIIEEKGLQFHPDVVNAFVRAYDKGKLQPMDRERVEIDASAC